MADIFFYSSKLIWILLKPDTWLIILIVLLAVYKSKFFSILVIALLILISIIPIGDFLLRPLESDFLPPKNVRQTHGVIILGGGEEPIQSREWDMPQINSAGDRLITGVLIANQYPNTKLIYSGGTGSLDQNTVKGANIAREIFNNLDQMKNRVIYEDKSRNTRENALFVKEIVQTDSTKPWLLITSAFHMRRSYNTFCKVGFTNIIPYPTDHRSGGFKQRIGWNFSKNFEDLNTGLREWIGLVAYKVKGYTDHIFNAKC